MNPEIRIVESAELVGALRAKVLALCTDAYEEDFTSCLDLLRDATHVLALLNGEIVAHAAWVPRELRVGKSRRPLRCAYVEAVATGARLQRQGLGTQVLKAIPAHLERFEIAALSPSEPDFYARCGWQMWQGPLFHVEHGRRVASLDEQVMVLRLPKTPLAIDLDHELETDWRPGDVW
jgi:GNAT superfamily N-acetyltransferase